MPSPNVPEHSAPPVLDEVVVDPLDELELELEEEDVAPPLPPPPVPPPDEHAAAASKAAIGAREAVILKRNEGEVSIEFPFSCPSIGAGMVAPARP